MKQKERKNYSLIEKYIFNIFEFIFAPGFFVSTRAIVVGIVTLALLYGFYLLNSYIIYHLGENETLIYVCVLLAVLTFVVFFVVRKLSEYKNFKK